MKHGAVSAEASKVYNPVGRCIYCGAGPGTRLSREHIVPIGLGGGLVLPKASCESCSKITQKFEETCLRNTFLPYRVYVGLMRHPQELREGVKENGEFLVIPRIFGEPGLIYRAPPGRSLAFTYQLHADGDEIDRHVQRLAAGEIRFDMDAFARMLAKIAHSYAVAELGLDGIDPELPDLILGKNSDLASYLIGASPHYFPARRDRLSHQISLGLLPHGERQLVCVHIRLFATHNTPAYLVIAGELITSRQDLLERFELLR
jgi:hypothetical protein